MKKVRIYLPLLGALIGLLPLLLHLVLTWVGPSHVSASLYVLFGPVVVAVVFAVAWFRDVRAEADEASTVRAVLLWASLGIAVLVATVAFSHLNGHTEVELFPGERYRLMPTVVATVAVSGFQALLAAVPILLDRRAVLLDRREQYGIPGGGAVTFFALVLTLLVPAGAGVMTERALRPPQPVVEHLVAGAESTALEIPLEIEGVPRVLDIPEEAVRGIQPVSSGMLLELEDGVMVMDPRTGDELWRYRQPDTWVEYLVDPGMETVVVELTPDRDSEETDPLTTRVTLDTSSGQILHSVKSQQSILGLAKTDSPSNNPPFEGESVVIKWGSDSILDVFGASSGALLWEFNGSPECTPNTSNGEDVINRPEITEEHVFIPVRCLRTDGESIAYSPVVVHAFDAATGELLWTHSAEDTNDYTAGVVMASQDGSLLYRYDFFSKMYFTIETDTGNVIDRGLLEHQDPFGDTRGNLMGNGVLLQSGRTLTLTDLQSMPTHTLELPPLEEGVQWELSATDEALHVVEWADDEPGPVTLTSYPWDGSDPRTVENVLNRDLPPDERVGIQVVPGGIIVYTSDPAGFGYLDDEITSAVAVT